MGQWRIDMMLEPGTIEQWVFRRDRNIFRAREDMVLASPDGIPFLSPVGVLLYKAKHLRDKDEADFSNVLPTLPQVELDWLNSALKVAHPGHPWIKQISKNLTI
jgi:hypothetical protein